MNLEEKLISKDKQCQIVCNYLKELCNSDEYLRNAILNKKNNTVVGMWSYIREHARKEASNGCACIDDKTVFGWARDYWLDVVDTVEQKEKNDLAKKSNRIIAKHEKQKNKEENDEKFNNYYESDLFGGLV